MSISPFHGGLVFLEDQNNQLAGSSSHGKKSKEESKLSEAGSELNKKDINEFFNPRKSDLPLDEKIRLVMSVGEEVTTEAELKEIIKNKPLFRCYDGFEPSGRMHIA
jgi:hypothetical protein